MAGLSTILPFAVQVDNQAPQIQLPGEWDIWDTVTFNAHDSDSGLANAELVISDPQNRWPKRIYTYQPGHLPLSFQWDRRFADGTLAPMGSYDVSATATDRMGNTRKVSASLRILIVLPPPPTSTPLGEPLATATPTATPSALATLAATSTPTSGAGSIPFGATEEPPALGAVAPTPSLAPRATPTESTFSSWLGSLLPPAAPAANPQSHSTDGILWGAGALAAMAGMTAYYQQKRREDEEAQRAAVHAQFAAEQAEKERQQKAQAKVMAKLEKQWAEEKFKEQAYQQWKAEQEQAKAVDSLSAADSGKKVLASPAPNISMPQGLPPEAQQAFLHGGSAAQDWIDNNAAQLQAEQQAKLEKQRRDAQAKDTAASYSSQAAAWLGIDKYIRKPKMPTGVSAEVQQAFQHGGSAAQSWIDKNKAKLQDEHKAQQARWAEEQERKKQADTWAAFREMEKNVDTVISTTPAAIPIAVPAPLAPNTPYINRTVELGNLLTGIRNELSALILLKDINNVPDVLATNSPSAIESIFTDHKVIQEMKKIEGLPAVKLILPVIQGLGWDNIPAPLVKTLNSDAMIRTAGRVLGSWELTPWSYVPGIALTVGPNLYHNTQNGSSSQRITADLFIDGTGSVVTEVASIIVSSAFMVFPPAYMITRFLTETYFSAMWESAANRYDWRDGLTQLLTPAPPLCEPPVEYIPAAPVPTAEIFIPQPTGTSLPPTNSTFIDVASDIQAASTPDLSTPEESKILPTQTPMPPP